MASPVYEIHTQTVRHEFSTGKLTHKVVQLPNAYIKLPDGDTAEDYCRRNFLTYRFEGKELPSPQWCKMEVCVDRRDHQTHEHDGLSTFRGMVFQKKLVTVDVTVFMFMSSISDPDSVHTVFDVSDTVGYMKSVFLKMGYESFMCCNGLFNTCNDESASIAESVGPDATIFVWNGTNLSLTSKIVDFGVGSRYPHRSLPFFITNVAGQLEDFDFRPTKFTQSMLTKNDFSRVFVSIDSCGSMSITVQHGQEDSGVGFESKHNIILFLFSQSGTTEVNPWMKLTAPVMYTVYDSDAEPAGTFYIPLAITGKKLYSLVEERYPGTLWKIYATFNYPESGKPVYRREIDRYDSAFLDLDYTYGKWATLHLEKLPDAEETLLRQLSKLRGLKAKHKNLGSWMDKETFKLRDTCPQNIEYLAGMPYFVCDCGKNVGVVSPTSDDYKICTGCNRRQLLCTLLPCKHELCESCVRKAVDIAAM
jgi:hypothetical protein